MRLFKTKYFHRWAKHEKLADESLLKSFQVKSELFEVNDEEKNL